jgi:hypothetical protein
MITQEFLVYSLSSIDHFLEGETGMHMRMAALGHLLRLGRVLMHPE